MMTNKKFVEMLKLAADVKTLYVLGGFGSPAGYGNNRTRFTNNYPYNRQPDRAKMIANASDNTFFFDCVCLGKAILWGWCAHTRKVYGGAVYQSNGVPDFGSETAMNYCTDVSTDFSNLTAGEWLYMTGHIGYYIGGGQVIECTPMWKNKVQYTKLSDRAWQKHGKLKYIEYVKEDSEMKVTCPKCGHSFDTNTGTNEVSDARIEELALAVIRGEYGNGAERKAKLGDLYNRVQARVDEILR